MPALLFDAHLDLAMNLIYYDRDITLPLSELNSQEQHFHDTPFRGKATATLPEMRKAGVAVCIATLLARSGPALARKANYQRTDLDFVTREGAYCNCHAQLAYYHLLERQGQLKIIRTGQELQDHWASWSQASDRSALPIGIILSMEGADAVLQPQDISYWHSIGLRAIGPAHYGHSHYASGTGVVGPITDAGIELLHQMSQHHVALDVTHLCDMSFEQAIDIYQGPLWASHHNCRELVNWDRQLTDSQIRRLIDRGAVIGAAMDAVMLHPNWVRGQTSPNELHLSSVVDHVDHICQIAGNADNVGIGSDLDGGYGHEQTPDELKSINDLHRLAPMLSNRGFNDDQIDGFFYGNWLRKLSETLP